MNKEHFCVRPLGKYGQTYILVRKKYNIYRAYLVMSYIVVFSLGLIEFEFEDFYKNSLGLPENTPLTAALVFSFLSVSGAVKLAYSWSEKKTTWRINILRKIIS